jgi:hypothetical protein
MTLNFDWCVEGVVERAAGSLFDDLDQPDVMQDARDTAVASSLVKASRRRYLFRHSRNRKGNFQRRNNLG